MQSVWTDSVNFPNFDKLKKDIRTDVLIIGGGITGLIKAAWNMMLTAYLDFSGLYTSNFINAIHPGIWGEEMYYLSTWIIVAVIFFFIFFIVYNFYRYY